MSTIKTKWLTIEVIVNQKNKKPATMRKPWGLGVVSRSIATGSELVFL